MGIEVYWAVMQHFRSLDLTLVAVNLKKDTTPEDDFDEVASLDVNVSQKCHAEESVVFSTDTNNCFVSCMVVKHCLLKLTVKDSF